ncbi:MAG: valine--tRNA ligase [Chlorobium sp.]|uniref:valine--tRNA ligase n=1 Tax=Chlorobium sp. TaxID=1095 RepID=UPI0025B8354E|nr:valine--tRNA ligase [Chlorobium sp.]MCF8215500.1 valine--tRNA ligase [Chlorobium sp.]MCF8270275.1 valine--tRNA ligase [Chlorobium sp.]MCF8286707.1 valine--tRNA ligase [Chlorobium sp.]MCF8290400.1 valine--tRNA ligase [Chlorobium sp.]MCF8384283.1 valine--tRNA ligase [Chlorobium sp.]
MSEETAPFNLEKTYNHQEVESRWSSALWEAAGSFHAESSRVLSEGKTPYTVLMPPPNVTGSLTLGHVLNHTLQDIFIRYSRMTGREALWLPGTDHAGIATQTVVEKKLRNDGVSRHDLGRKDFLGHVWQWREEYGGLILRQLRRLGISCDWRRNLFTMDDSASEAVVNAFIALYRDGLIYRGTRIINWCPVSQTALSDEEVIMKSRKDKLVYVRYPLVKRPGEYITIATVRPETILADVAIAVNPADPRYSDLVGELVVVPVAGRHIPVIADDYVDIEFGTGALKITPAHDPNDYEVARRHNLPIISVVGRDGRMTDDFGYAGMDRFDAREKIMADLEERGSLERVEEYEHNVGYSERADVVVEPYLSEQWFVRMKPLAEKALQVVNDGEIRFHPPHWINTYRHWMENIQDWCISRQLWWGHRIPAWYDPEGRVWVASSCEEACRLAGTDKLVQEEDVLDTWFSSWLWPLTTLGWTGPHCDNDDLRAFYPTDTLVTGPDIIFFWVARMIMAGLYFRGDVPFRDVYFTSIIRDMKGRKLSKSLGNSPDPLKVIDTYGTDALRFTIIYIAPLGQDVLFGEEKCELGRNFATKLWNASRLVFMQREKYFASPEEFETAYAGFVPEIGTFTFSEERVLMARYHAMLDRYHSAFEQFRVNDILRNVYDFFWGDYCDWYLEALKTSLAGSSDQARARNAVLLAVHVLEGMLQALHPVMPFITDEIWHHIMRRPENSTIALSGMPESLRQWFDCDISLHLLPRAVISETRSLRSLFAVPASSTAPLTLRARDKGAFDTLSANREFIAAATRCSVEVASSCQRPEHAAASVVEGNELFIQLEGLISFDKERARLQKEIGSITSYVAALKKKLSNQGFVANAPGDVIEKERSKLAEAERNLEKLSVNLQVLG